MVFGYYTIDYGKEIRVHIEVSEEAVASIFRIGCVGTGFSKRVPVYQTIRSNVQKTIIFSCPNDLRDLF
jgi:hypothetical protein